MTAKQPAVFDNARLIAAFFIIVIHTSPLLSFSPTADFALTRVAARFAVPLFFMLSGYFLNPAKPQRLLKKTTVLYTASICLYLPLNVYSGYFQENTAWEIGKDLLWNGTFYHLWYLPAVISGAALTAFLIQKLGLHAMGWIAAGLYAIGLFGDSYYGLAVQTSAGTALYGFLFQIFDYTRNGLFFAPLFLFLGMTVRQSRHPFNPKIYVMLFASLLLLFAEGLTLHHFQLQRHDSMYLFLVPFMYSLFLVLSHFNQGNIPVMRSLSMLIYILHPWCIVFVRGFAKLTGLQAWLLDNSLLYFLAVSAGSLCASGLLLVLWSRLKTQKPAPDSRAWIEIDPQAICQNVQALEKCLPSQCRLMAVVKANAYGHDVRQIIPALKKAGIQAYAVATLQEGIQLRKLRVRGEVLILGYTAPQDARLLQRYRLTQAIFSPAYAAELAQQRARIRGHIKIDTGMHRLGIPYTDQSAVRSLFQYKNLHITGMFSHFCAADSTDRQNIEYTEKQAERFFRLAADLKSQGLDPGILHIQSTYGILNYPGLPCGYARAGIGLYGVLSQAGSVRQAPSLAPVLSLRARVASVQSVAAGEQVGYGRAFQAPTDLTAAVISIGYADGIPRQWKNGAVLIAGQLAPVIGQICMDQLIVDASQIPGVYPGQIATLIGRDQGAEIRCETFAFQCGTITNEILSRLGPRLPRIRKREPDTNPADTHPGSGRV